MAIPKTMDNDVQGTEYCIGFSSAITRAKELINRQRTTLGSHERIGVFRIFGRDAGFSALFTAYVTSARCLIPEAPFDLDRLAAILAEDHHDNPSHYAFVIAAEGAIWKGGSLAEYGEADAFGHRHKVNVGEALAAEIRRRTGDRGGRLSELTYDLRSGEADSLDQMVAMTFANVAMDLIADGAARPDGRDPRRPLRHTTLPDPTLGPRSVDVERLYDVERFRPKYSGKLGEPLLLLGTPSGHARRTAAEGVGAARDQAGRPELARIARATADMSSSPWPSATSPSSTLGAQPAHRQLGARPRRRGRGRSPRSLRWRATLKPSG